MSSRGIDDVIGSINGIVASDGGRVELVDGGEDGNTPVRVRYEMKANESCSTCTVTPQMLEQFLQESLRTHGLPADQVIVETSDR